MLGVKLSQGPGSRAGFELCTVQVGLKGTWRLKVIEVVEEMCMCARYMLRKQLVCVYGCAPAVSPACCSGCGAVTTRLHSLVQGSRVKVELISTPTRAFHQDPVCAGLVMDKYRNREQTVH